MKLFIGVLTLFLALSISGVAAYFSIVGLAALFAAAFWPVVVMGSVLEAGKLVAAGWLHANWRNPNVHRLHKAYLSAAVFVLMLITGLGIYGFLAKGHLEQEAPLASVELQINQITQKITQVQDERNRLTERDKQLDQSVSVLLGTSKSAREARMADRARGAQKREREQIRKDLAAKDKEINDLTASLVPLRTHVADVSAKLGPVKYVASLFGWQDTQTAVQFVILMIMFVFDPLAVMLLLSATITMGEYWAARRARPDGGSRPPGRPSEAPMDADTFTTPSQPGGTLVTELPKPDPATLDALNDLDYFTEKLRRGMRLPPDYLASTPTASFSQEAPSFTDKLHANMASDWSKPQTLTETAAELPSEAINTPVAMPDPVVRGARHYRVQLRGGGVGAEFHMPRSFRHEAHEAPETPPAAAIDPDSPPPISGWLSEPWFPKKT